MVSTNSLVRTLGTAGVALMALSGPSLADDKFGYTWTITGASDYLFRGISFTGNDPTVNSYLELTYNTGGILGTAYLGFWTSNIDNGSYGPWEQDFYAGIRPATGPVSWDLGVLYYTYGAKDGLNTSDLDYVEFQIAATVSPIKNLSTTLKGYWTPDQGFAYPETETIEGTIGYTLPAVGIFTPTISGQLGYSDSQTSGDFPGGAFFTSDGSGDVEESYTYWNAGVKLAVEKFTFDLRYWDTDLAGNLSDERFFFAASVTLP
jgi:uncharacterized protein (TIGR02001 family)